MTRKDVIDAIINNWVIEATYDDGEGGGGKGRRTLEPIAFGFNKFSGNLVVRAWQREGSSKSFDARPPKYKRNDPLTKVPGYRLFNVKKFKTWKPTGEKYRIDKNFLRQNRPKINPNDRGMSSVIASIEIIKAIEFELVFDKIKEGLLTVPKLTSKQKTLLRKLDFSDFLKSNPSLNIKSLEDFPSVTSKVVLVKNTIGTWLRVKKQPWYKKLPFNRYVTK